MNNQPNFQGLDPALVLDMNRATTRTLTDMQRMWRAFPDVIAIIDDQITLLHHNVQLHHNAESIRYAARMGKMNQFGAAVTLGGISRAASENAAEIRSNGAVLFQIISVHMSGQRIEA